MNPDSALLVAQIKQALSLVRVAAEAHRNGSPLFAQLVAESERSYETILAGFCPLTDEEADLIEPLFTGFEQELYQLSGLIMNADSAP